MPEPGVRDDPFPAEGYDDQDVEKLGDVEPGLTYSYFVARNLKVGDKNLVDFVLEEEILDNMGKREFRTHVPFIDGEVPWEDAISAHLERAQLLFSMLDATIPEGAQLLPADWGAIIHMLQKPLEKEAERWRQETDENMSFPPEVGVRMCEWLYVHYLLGALSKQRRSQIIERISSLNQEEIFPEYKPIKTQVPKRLQANFSKIMVNAQAFFNKIRDVLTMDELRIMAERENALGYKEFVLSATRDAAADLYRACPELSMYHINDPGEQERFQEHALQGYISHNINQSIFKRRFLVNPM